MDTDERVCLINENSVNTSGMKFIRFIFFNSNLIYILK